MRHTRTGWFFTVTGFLACPCHLVITLPLAVALLSGTALGGWIATHEEGIAAGATVYFVGALVLGFTLLSMRRASEAGAACSLPPDRAARDGQRIIDALPGGSGRTHRSGDGGRACCPPDQSNAQWASRTAEHVAHVADSSRPVGRDG